MVTLARTWVIWDAAMERLVFGGHRPVHPGAHPGLASRTITVGSASKELRMIGWRVGWVAGPQPIMKDIGLVGLTNVVCQVGIAQGGRFAPGPGLRYPVNRKIFTSASEIIASAKTTCMTRYLPR